MGTNLIFKPDQETHPMPLSADKKNRLVLRIGLATLVIGTGLRLVLLSHGSWYLHVLSGLCLGISLPTLLFGLVRSKFKTPD